MDSGKHKHHTVHSADFEEYQRAYWRRVRKIIGIYHAVIIAAGVVLYVVSPNLESELVSTLAQIIMAGALLFYFPGVVSLVFAPGSLHGIDDPVNLAIMVLVSWVFWFFILHKRLMLRMSKRTKPEVPSRGRGNENR